MATLRLGDTAPDFTAETSQGILNFYDYVGNGWGILFSHPADFTPVCTTELGAAAKCKSEFDRRNVKMMALSADSLQVHDEWIQDINETQNTVVNFPIVSDTDRNVSKLYGMVTLKADGTLTARSVFIIDPDKKVKLMLTYPASTGCSFYELLRVIDSLQLAENYKVATPANWEQGDKVVVPQHMSTEEAEKRFAAGIEEVKPYLRLTPDPTL